MAKVDSLSLEDTLPLFSLDSTGGEVVSDTGWRRVPGPVWPVPPGVPDFLAVDFETYYTAKYSLQNRELQRWGYVAHAAFNAYLVALELYKGGAWWRWVGHPKHAPWHDCAKVAQWVSHEAVFDELVFHRLRKDGIVPADVKAPDTWDCTSDYAGYRQFDRGLERCAPHLIQEQADKSVRAKARAGAAGGEEMRNYAATDSRQCAWIWAKHSLTWPLLERFLSREQRRAGYAGITIDLPLMRRARARMVEVQKEVVSRVPWANLFPVSSSEGIARFCGSKSIPPPPSLTVDEPATVEWNRRYKHVFPWLDDIRAHTKATQVVSHIDQMESRTRRDGTVPFELIYRKAPHTARWQSGGDLRIHNLDKDSFEGFNVRHFISCPSGFSLLNADSSQIEPRVLNWIVGDKAFLEACRRGRSPYDAHAMSSMGWTPQEVRGIVERLKDKDPARYALAKARLLALGYQAGDEKFCEMARTMAGITVFVDERSFSPNLNTERDPSRWEFYRESTITDRIARGETTNWAVLPSAKFSVKDFRDNSPLIAHRDRGIWARCEAEMAADDGRDHIVLLPNGEKITYFDVRVQRTYNEERRRFERKLDAWVVKDSRNPKQHVETYGGKLTENRVQRIARELLAYWKAECIRKLGPYGYKYRWSVHDELNGYCPTREAKALLQAKLEIMSTPPPWAHDLPVAAEGAVLDHYAK